MFFTNTHTFSSFIKKHIKYLVILIPVFLLLAMRASLLSNLEPRFNEIEDDYMHSRAINLCEETSPQELSKLLMVNGYVANQRDADFVADTIVGRLKRGMKFDNLYDLQKRDYGQVGVSILEQEKILTNELTLSYEKLGLTDSLPSIQSLGTQLNIGRTGEVGHKEVHVYAVEEKSRNKIFNMILGPKKIKHDCADVIIRLVEYYVDSNSVEHADLVGYAKTDNNGYATFSGLDKNKGYGFLPIRKGYEFGSSKGNVQGEFDKHKFLDFSKKPAYEFEQKEHRIQMLDNATLKRIKEDGTITVRSPESFKEKLNIFFFLVFLGWLVPYLILVIRRKLDTASSIIISMGMFLTGLCVIVMFAIQNPLTEELRGIRMAWKVLIGILFICLFQCKRINFVDFYRKSSHFGWFSMAIALFLTGLLFTPLGQAIGGMTVNLKIPGLRSFQPSEIVKFLTLFYVAALFSRKHNGLINDSQPRQTDISTKAKSLAGIIICLVILFGMYTFLGDMGPALVIGFTFVLLYSLVKSKDSFVFEKLSVEEKRERRFTCDFAMLVYGVLSFAFLVVVGYWIAGATMSLVFAVVWFGGWIPFGKYFKRRNQFHESAFIFNLLVFALLFFGQIAKYVPITIIHDTAERYEKRTDMCISPWGNLDVCPDNMDYKHGRLAKPVMNTQIANGLWAMATGGLTGQGLGNGTPNVIPAFNTDMILASMMEQIGSIGLIIVVIAFFILLWGFVEIGYNSDNFFSFFFCLGLAIMNAVQFFIIALGSCRMMPLTGITVPFLSYGGVSMVFNLIAMGIVLSISSNSKTDNLSENENIVKPYGFAKRIVRYAAITIFGIIIVFGWLRYSVFERNKTLVRPAYVLSKDGWPTIEYNPRIAMLTKGMLAGDIYDRNGVILATSDPKKLANDKQTLVNCGLERTDIDDIASAHTKRYYPFAEHLFFMLGDQNQGLRFSYNEDRPIGYMAEAQHLAYLRDFDNLHDKKGRPTVKVTLSSNEIKSSYRYLNNSKRDTTIEIRLYDYYELVPYLKDGIYGKKLKKHNEKVEKGNNDLYLTIDARLQTDLQKQIEKYVQRNYNNNLLRISVVVLDAENGDLLTSANYPLPDYQRLREEDDAAKTLGKKGAVYSDNYKTRQWHAYTDRDLGLTYQTMPGSTAKVMSAMAGFQKLGKDAARKTYLVTKDDIIERGRATEPYQGKIYDQHRNFNRSTLVDKVDMWEAIVESSNCYFINLVNDNDLYDALGNIYEATGVGIGSTVPYYLTNEYTKERKDFFRKKLRDNQRNALAKYAKYKEENVHTIMNAREWKWAWGQGYENYELQASPLNMARVLSAIANNGKMPATQYLLPKNKYSKNLRDEHTTELLSSKAAKLLRGYMLAESANQKYRNKVVLPDFVGGKTGTPERYRYYYGHRGRSQRESRNDGWYVFFVEGKKCKDGHPLAVAVRMERGSGSGAAVRLTKEVILESLYINGYLK